MPLCSEPFISELKRWNRGRAVDSRWRFGLARLGQTKSQPPGAGHVFEMSAYLLKIRTELIGQKLIDPNSQLILAAENYLAPPQLPPPILKYNYRTHLNRARVVRRLKPARVTVTPHPT